MEQNTQMDGKICFGLKAFLVLLLAYVLSIIPCYAFLNAPLILYVGTKVVRDVIVLVILLSKKHNNFNEHFRLNTLIMAISGIVYVILIKTQYIRALYSIFRFNFLPENIPYQFSVEMIFDGGLFRFYLLILLIGFVSANWQSIKSFVMGTREHSQS